jgi:hypothetical protein
MTYLKTLTLSLVAVLVCLAVVLMEAGAVPEKGVGISKRCLNCHKAFQNEADVLAGNFKSRSNKAKSIQVNINGTMHVVKYTSDTKVKNVPKIKALKSPIPVKVRYQRRGTDLVATEIVAKPKMKVPKEQLIATPELAKLVGQGPEKGGYTLIDSRPGIKFQEGHIPTALSIPFPKMTQLKGKLPKDKNRLLIFYCEGVR